MIDGCIEPNPIASVRIGLNDQAYAGAFTGLQRIIQTLTNGLGPFLREINLDGVIVGQAVTPGQIRKDHLDLAASGLAPTLLVPGLWMEVPGHGIRSD